MRGAAERCHRVASSLIPRSRLSRVSLEPIGVTAAITPWNLPVAMITRKAGAALAAGYPMIVKLTPETPLSALAVARLAEAGVRCCVLQAFVGNPIELSQPLLRDTRVRALYFTGSTEVSRWPLEGRAAQETMGANIGSRRVDRWLICSFEGQENLCQTLCAGHASADRHAQTCDRWRSLVRIFCVKPENNVEKNPSNMNASESYKITVTMGASVRGSCRPSLRQCQRPSCSRFCLRHFEGI